MILRGHAVATGTREKAFGPRRSAVLEEPTSRAWPLPAPALISGVSAGASAMEHDDPAEGLTELRERRLSALELLQAAAGTGLAAYTVWALVLQPGFRRVPLRLQVPYVGANTRQVENVLSLLRGRPGKMVDLGSGDGRIVLAAHRCGLRPAVGYELNPWLVGLAWLHAWKAGCASKVCYLREDLWKVSLRDCHNVSVFLAPSVLPMLEAKLQAELPSGARVVSGRFPLPTWEPVAVVGEGLDRVWAYDVPCDGPSREAKEDTGHPPLGGTVG